VRTVAGLDIGTTKVSALIAEADEGGSLRIIGMGSRPSDGLRRGMVVDLERTVRSIAGAVEEAEQMAGVSVRSVYAGIGGDHVRGINSRGVIAVTRKDQEITQAEVLKVVEAAKAVAIPADREIFHVIPQEFIVDEQDGVRDPIGMSGARLEVEVHIVTGASTPARNVIKAIERAGLSVARLVLEPVASANAVLSEDERSLGVVLLDIGGGTTDIAVFVDGSIRHTAVLGLGGLNVSNDIAIGLRVPVDRAEQVKIEHGCALLSMVRENEIVRVPSVAGRTPRDVRRDLVVQMIEPRMEEILCLALKEVRRSTANDHLGAGVVLTGGASAMAGVPELAEQIFDLPARRGVPAVGDGPEAVKDPRHATGVGLLLHAVQDGVRSANGSGLVDRVTNPLRRWAASFFA